MNMEEQFYIDDGTVEVDTLEQNINDEMVGVLVLVSYRYEFDESRNGIINCRNVRRYGSNSLWKWSSYPSFYRDS